MPSTLETLLPKFKATQLKQLSFLCGAKTTGRKGELVERLLSLTQPPVPRSQPLVLSIDMGIRNLGYSLLSPAATLPGRKSKPAPLTGEALRSPPRVNLHAWQRRELFETLPDDPVDSDQFSPTSLAIAADRLVRRDLLPLKPTHVLIERQRWRSGGGTSIFEWTVRVNTLEAMLHASLRTLRELGHWDGEIISVAPPSVTRFWPAASAEDAPKKRRVRASKVIEGETKVRKESKSMQSKKHKNGVLTGWLKKGPKDQIILPANSDLENAIEQFRLRLSGARRSRSRNADDLAHESWPQKLDDLTDCLLQGVAWLKWEENRSLLLNEKRILELLDSDILDEEIVTPLDDV